MALRQARPSPAVPFHETGFAGAAATTRYCGRSYLPLHSMLGRGYKGRRCEAHGESRHRANLCDPRAQSRLNAPRPGLPVCNDPMHEHHVRVGGRRVVGVAER
jgi:hypothetical protein